MILGYIRYSKSYGFFTGVVSSRSSLMNFSGISPDAETISSSTKVDITHFDLRGSHPPHYRLRPYSYCHYLYPVMAPPGIVVELER